MVQTPNLSIQNNFIAGLKTQFTGLNFPENAATDSQNVIYTLTGDVVRRAGMDFENNFGFNGVSRAGVAVSSYKWNNVGGDGQTQVIVEQIGGSLFFYLATNATTSSPLSSTIINTSVALNSFLAAGSVANTALTECQFADGNGYLFVYHPNCDPFYCTFIPGSPPQIQSTAIAVQVRDFNGVYPEPGNPALNARPSSLSNEHSYNLQNQGWTNTNVWTAQASNTVGPLNIQVSGNTISIAPGSYTFPTGVVNGAAAGQSVVLTVGGALQWATSGGQFFPGGFNSSLATITGVVTSYNGINMVINITSGGLFFINGGGNITAIFNTFWSISQSASASTVSTFFSGVGVFPSNTDIWYEFKNTADVFSPSTTVANVSLSIAPAPRGHFILNAFTQNRTGVSGIGGLTSVSTTVRPRTGTWFQGRVWYTGVDGSQAATGDQTFYTWTENIYFSQIITDQTEFGFCYQEEDPTDEDLNELLPTDGGVITIQGSGAIDRLFPVQNGLIVFAANGIWFITGSQGIGFSATDYTITKISGIQSISATSYINVMGYPIFWNEEGIYAVTPGTNGILQVENLALDTILSFYNNIPLQSKKFARGDYNPITYEVQWCFKSTNETSITDRYQRDQILVYNVKNKAFYYHTLGNSGTSPWIHDIRYVAGPGGSTSPAPTFKYVASVINGGTYDFTFAELRDTTHYTDWFSHGDNINFISYFVAGYNLHGKAYARWQPVYVYLYLRNAVQNSYKIQGIWDYALASGSGRLSTVQQVTDNTSTTNFGMKIRRHKVRGWGLSFQLKVQSVDGKPFDVMGWSMFEMINQGV